MIPIDIQYELKKRSITQKQIAIEESKSEMAVSKVVNKQLVSNHIMRAVARRIEKEPSEVFPEYYLAKPEQRNAA